MEWYYSKRDKSTDHGLVDASALFDMAREGALKRSDLVWKKGTDTGWQRADSIEGLFDDLLTDEVEEDVAYDAPPTPGSTIRRRPRKGLLVRFLAVCVVLAGIATAAVLALERLYVSGRAVPGVPKFQPKVDAEAEEASRLAALERIRSNHVARIAALVEQHLDRQRIEEALVGISKLRDLEASESLIAPLASRIGNLEKYAARREQLKQMLSQGRLTTPLAKELFNICATEKRTGELYTLVNSLLDDPRLLTAPVALSSARLGAAAHDNKLLGKALAGFYTKSSKKGPVDDYIEVVDLYCSIDKTTQAMTLLESYLENESRNAVAWLELSALRAETGDSKGSLSALKSAVEHGGDPVRLRARADARFAPVRNTWTFKRYVKVR